MEYTEPPATTTCPHCSSPRVSNGADRRTYLCGTESLYDECYDTWLHDWGEGAGQVCRYIADLREQVEQLEQGQAVLVEELDQAKRAATEAARRLNSTHIGTMLRVHNQARTALAFAQSVIKTGEPWTDKCEEVIGGALTALRPMR